MTAPAQALVAVLTVSLASVVAGRVPASAFADAMRERPERVGAWARVVVPLTALVWAGLVVAEAKLGSAGASQVAFQWAYTPARARELLKPMQPRHFAWAGFSFGFDVVFMLCYPVVIALYITLRKAAHPMYETALAAAFASGLVDLFETCVFMALFDAPNDFSDVVPWMGSLASLAKYVLLIASIGFAVVGERASERGIRVSGTVPAPPLVGKAGAGKAE